MSQIALGAARWLVWGCLMWAPGCGQTTQRDDAGDPTNDAGRPANEAGASSQGAASSAGKSSAGSSVAGNAGLSGGGDIDIGIGGNLNSAAGETAAGPDPAVPLLDTALCDNAFVRVQHLPDTPLFFSGTFDGEPIDVPENTDVTEPPTVKVLRFGPRHVETIDLVPFLGASSYGYVEVTAFSCVPSGSLSLGSGYGLDFFRLASAQLSSITPSLDGYTGLTQGTVAATWVNDAGEQHVLDAKFTLHATMNDALAEP